MADNARQLVEDVLSRDMTREIWSGNYDKALPLSLYHFELPAILPAVFYMFRFGRSRGNGKFVQAFGSRTGTPAQRRRSATIEQIAQSLVHSAEFSGFEGAVETTILGDLLLCYCLENKEHGLGRDRQVQRVAPAHYMASWVDLPQSVAHLRHVPEMIVAMLADQKGDHVDLNEDGDRTWFAVGRGHEDNVLLRAFSHGVIRRGKILSDRTSDRFDEEDESVGLDQLLMTRLAQQLEAAPKEGGRISNQRPVAEKAAREFSEDMRRFLRSYAAPIPRHSLVGMLDSCIAVGMTTILTSTVETLSRWAEEGEVPGRQEQRPVYLFVDCSNGVDLHIRAQGERSMDDLMPRLERFFVVLMALRLLDYQARGHRKIKKEKVPTRPYATAWLNLLGELLHERHPEARRIHDRIEGDAEKLAEKLKGDYPEAAGILDDTDGERNPVWRLARGLMALMTFQRGSFASMFDSSLLTERPNGLAVKRTTTQGTGSDPATTRRKRDVRSLVFTDSVLDYLVHLHLLPNGNKSGVRSLSFRDFIRILRERHGFHVDTAPPGMTISNELLQRNRAILERRLRDLGLLVGVNDAESMKRLQPRFKPAEEL